MLATLDFSGGVINYDGGATGSTLTVELVGTNYQFTDTEIITVSGAQAADITGSGTMVVLAPIDLVTATGIDLLGGTDSAAIAGLTLTGNLSATAEKVTINGPVTSGDTLTINANGGAITDGNGTAVNLSAVNGVMWTTTDDNSAIGTADDVFST